MLHEPCDFRGFQLSFAARVRDPIAQPLPPGVDEKRMSVYEELLFSNLEETIGACYPVTKRILGEDAWKALIRRFFAEYRCQSPLFRDIPGEFLRWTEGRSGIALPVDSCLYALMHYEWLELIVSISGEEAVPDHCDTGGDLLTGKPLLNPTAQVACYQFPVHRMSPEFVPTEPSGEPQCYILFRGGDDEVSFVSLNAVSARLLEVLAQGRRTGLEAVREVTSELGPYAPLDVVDMGADMLVRLRDAGAISGIWRTS